MIKPIDAMQNEGVVMVNRKWILALIVALTPLLVVLAQGQRDVLPAIVVLGVDGRIDYQREGWRTQLPLTAGAVLDSADFVFPTNASLRVMCPDGTTRGFLPSELFDQQPIACEIDPATYIIGDPGTTRLSLQRGGRQDVTIPFLWTPRATTLRAPDFDLIWNAPPNVSRYEITLFGGGGTVWQSGDLDPADVVTTHPVFGSVGTITPDYTLQQGIAYTVEICVLFDDLRAGCTTDPGWSSDVGLAFYYVPDAELDARLDAIATDPDTDPAQRLYAQALLLSLTQPTLDNPPAEPIAYYHEAISLLEQILRDHPDSSLATSPALYNTLGELYREVNLPLSSTRMYARAVELALDNTEIAAVASIGAAMTTPADPVPLYNAALNHYEAFLSEAAFEAQFQQTCNMIGDICLDLARCETRMDDCTAWFR